MLNKPKYLLPHCRRLLVSGIAAIALFASGCTTQQVYRAKGTEKLALSKMAVVVRGQSEDIGLFFESLDGVPISGPNRLEVTPGEHVLQLSIKYVNPGSSPGQIKFTARAGIVYEVFFYREPGYWSVWMAEKKSGKVVFGRPKSEHRRFYRGPKEFRRVR